MFQNKPSLSPIRAVLGLLCNLIVLPGLGTLVSGDAKRRNVGWVQLGLGVLAVPLIGFFVHDEKIRAHLATAMMGLAFWSAITSLLTLWDLWREERAVSRRPTPQGV